MIELFAFAIVAVWLALRFAKERDRRALALRLLCIAIAAWIGEESCIRLYGFYGYAPIWRVFLLDVPLAIVCIWPVVIQSALDLTRSTRVRRALLVAGLVVIDASLIEPISVAAGLWSWTEPGPFQVPIIGILGWGFFAFGVALVIEKRAPLALIAGPLACHALLLSTWWVAFRWLPRGTGELPFVIAAAAGSLAIALRLLTSSTWISRRDVVLRAPAALFFFALLALFARDNMMLIAYAVAFAPPWLVLMVRAR